MLEQSLNKIIISNFQSHKRSELKLCNNVNAIIGESDVGKSAIFRAITWALFNKCDDKAFIRRGQKQAAVDLIFQDGIEVSREKDDKNRYIVSNGKEEQTHTAFKTEIPESVLAALNLRSINVQSQHDPPFLLSNSSGDVAKQLNKIANLQIIDTTVSNIRKKVQSTNRDIQTTQDQIAELEESLQAFKFLSKLEKDVKAYEELQEEEKDVLRAIQELGKLIDSVQEGQVELKEVNQFLGAEKEVKRVLEKLNSWDNLEEETKDLDLLIRLTSHLEGSVEQYEKIVEADVPVKEVLKKMECWKVDKEEIQKLQDLILIGERYNTVVERFDLSIEKQEAEYKELFGERCLLCGK